MSCCFLRVEAILSANPARTSCLFLQGVFIACHFEDCSDEESLKMEHGLGMEGTLRYAQSGRNNAQSDRNNAQSDRNVWKADHRTRPLKNGLKSFASGKYGRLTLIAGIIVVADQITKAIVLSKMALYQSISVVPGFFSLTHIHNPGGAFGFLAQQNATLRIGVFIFASAVAIVLIFIFYRQIPKTHPILSAGLALIFGGALGNLIDRLRFGKVVDFFDFYVGRMHWPAFNVADSAITVGVAIFLAHLVFGKLPE